MKILTRPFVDHKHRLSLALFAFLVVAQFTLLNLDIVLFRQPAQCLRVGDLLVLHEEVHRIATLAASETLADLTGW